MAKSQDIRNQFLHFFKEKGHNIVPAVPIVAKDNPSLLFVNAGMNPFTSVLLGEETPSAPRLANAQPCLRVTGKHNDLEVVGHDTYHHTFFEMLGNWSFGDYFKEKAIPWAWELLVEVYKLPANRLYATVFQGNREDDVPLDAESLALWQHHLPDDHIIHGDKEANFWEMGKTGPCGPCTEMHIDLRSDKERSLVPAQNLINKGHPQVIELWNLVFIAYQRRQDQCLVPLKDRHVDTGMGFERLVMALQGKHSTYATDLLRPLLEVLGARIGKTYGKDATTDLAMRVIVDHVRAATFAIADGARPSTQKAGYVVRRILRRAIRYGFTHLNLKKPFIHDIVPILVEVYGSVYRRLAQHASSVQQAIEQEEIGFLRTLASGLKRFYTMTSQLPPDAPIKGTYVFELYDTYGFPPDLTSTIASEKGYTIDQKGFDVAMLQQKTRGKQTTHDIGDWHIVKSDLKHSLFVGYDEYEATAQVVKYRTVKRQGHTIYQVVLDQTPFYPEGGGQVGDVGSLIWSHERIEVVDTKKEHGVILHYTNTLPSSPTLRCQAVINRERRKSTARNHTTAHLLGAALRQVLGKHVIQKGSLVNDKLCRLDFAHGQPMTAEEVARVTHIINNKIRQNIPLHEQRHLPMAEAKKMGAVATFHEKYGTHVRVVAFDPTFSVELCGGTHVQATGEIGIAHVVSEGSSSAGVRRLVLITGEAAEKHLNQLDNQLKAIASLLRNTQQTPLQSIQKLLEDHKKLRKRVALQEQKALMGLEERLLAAFRLYLDHYVVVEEVEVSDVNALKKTAFNLVKKQRRGVAILGTVINGQAYLMVSVGAALLTTYNARDILSSISHFIDGKGGGNPSFAIATGTRVAGLAQALKQGDKQYIH